MAYSVKIVSGTNNIPTSFDETAGSLASSVFPSASRVAVLNYTSEILAFSLGEYTAAPSSSFSTNPNQVIVPAASGGNPGVAVLDEIGVGNNSRCYLRSEGSAATSGNVYVTVWAR